MTDRYIMTGAEIMEIWPLLRDYHYRHSLPAAVQASYAARKVGGLFGDTGEVMAGIMFSVPPARWSEGVIELSRLVRHPDYDEPLTKLIAFALSYMRKRCDLIVSFADWMQSHHGGIYQAAGFNYHGMRPPRVDGLFVNGRFRPRRTLNVIYGTSSAELLADWRPELEIQKHWDIGKHLYWKALTVAGKTRAKRMGFCCLPYPKPNAASPSDERPPSRESFEHPEVAAPDLLWWREDEWHEPTFAF